MSRLRSFSQIVKQVKEKEIKDLRDLKMLTNEGNALFVC